MIIVDSREKKWKHIERYFKKNKIDYRVQKLDVGDFALEGVERVVIDRKADLVELSSNLTNKSDSARFWREVRRAKERGTKLIILCEHGHGIQKPADVIGWQNEFTHVSGHKLMDEMFRLQMAYGVDFQFCDRKETAQKILEILGYL